MTKTQEMRERCPDCGLPTIPANQEARATDMRCDHCADAWEADLDAADPDNFWIDRASGERVNAVTGERTKQES